MNKMTFHPDKCKVLSISKIKYEPILPFQLFFYSLGDTLLDYVDSEKDLGVIINDTLSTAEQCDNIYKIMNQKLGMLKRVCYFQKNSKQKRALYLAVVRSQLNHCYVVWRPTSDTKINRLESIQKRAVKWILNELEHHYNDWEYTFRLNDLNLLPMKYFFTQNDLIIMHNIYYGLHFIKLPAHFTPFNDSDRSRLRSNINPPEFFNARKETIELSSMRNISHDSKSLKCTLPKISYGIKQNFIYRAHMLWNHIPINIREVTSTKSFKILLTSHLWDLAMKPD